MFPLQGCSLQECACARRSQDQSISRDHQKASVDRREGWFQEKKKWYLSYSARMMSLQVEPVKHLSGTFPKRKEQINGCGKSMQSYPALKACRKVRKKRKSPLGKARWPFQTNTMHARFDQLSALLYGPGCP